jgi:lipid-binding SYLF domain-containing protein
MSPSLLVSRPLAVAVFSALLAVPLTAPWRTDADQKLGERAKRAGEIVAELVKEPDHAPPRSLLSHATCVAAIPEVVQVGLGGVGGRVGFGLASCRTGSGWSLPTFVALKGGSFGLQIGAQATDVVLVFVNENAPRLIASNSFDIGAQASVAAGPVGRNLSAETDYKLSAEIYSYSKTKGLFAGIDIAGTKWEIDSKSNEAVYGPARGADVRALLAADGSGGPAVVHPFVRSLRLHVGSATP